MSEDQRCSARPLSLTNQDHARGTRRVFDVREPHALDQAGDLHGCGGVTETHRRKNEADEHPFVRGSLRDLIRMKLQLIAANAMLSQQRIVLNQSVKRPHLSNHDRGPLVLLASRVHAWKDTLLIVKPDTLLRWHHQGFRLFCNGSHRHAHRGTQKRRFP